MGAHAADPGLYRKLVWQNLFRVVTVTVLLGGTLFVARGRRHPFRYLIAPARLKIGRYMAIMK